MTQPSAAAIVLAAGLGTRMRSDRPKVLHAVAGRSMIGHVAAALAPLSLDPLIAVIGPESKPSDLPSGFQTILQTDRRGTGDAARIGATLLGGFAGTVLILAGDTPLIRSETLSAAVAARASGNGIALVGFRAADPTGYGRLLRDPDGSVLRIVEHKDASDEERLIPWCNSGIYAVDATKLAGWLAKLQPNNAQGEYYLTDIVALARAEGLRVAMVEAPEEDVHGVNSRIELARAEAVWQDRLRRAAMAGGATLIDPATVFFCHDTVIGRDVVIQPNVVFGPGVIVGDRVEIRAFSHIEGAKIAAGAIIGPFARLRPGTVVGEGGHIGNFVELKNTVLEAGAKANHLSYLGDAQIGAGANIGAGTITCNYDGFGKYRTQIGAGAFIGSNTALVAPVTVGAGAIVGAGSVIASDVPEDALAVTRSEQTVREGAAARFRARKAQKE
jgi:bifunctional UDP-N-acetylglucosamine pyrophosphorylase/glucosamine-1-phosphate N-acetyltransferase